LVHGFSWECLRLFFQPHCQRSKKRVQKSWVSELEKQNSYISKKCILSNIGTHSLNMPIFQIQREKGSVPPLLNIEKAIRAEERAQRSQLVSAVRVPPQFFHAELTRRLAISHPFSEAFYLNGSEFSRRSPTAIPSYIGSNKQRGWWQSILLCAKPIFCRFAVFPPYTPGFFSSVCQCPATLNSTKFPPASSIPHQFPLLCLVAQALALNL
jgi:hypothetical protein